jgi:hypothetical protein
MRKYRRTFHCIGSVDSDPCPGLSDSWDVFIARTRDGRFFAYQSGADTDFELGGAKEAFEWIQQESGIDDLWTVAGNLKGIRGFGALVKLLAKYLKQFEED